MPPSHDLLTVAPMSSLRHEQRCGDPRPMADTSPGTACGSSRKQAAEAEAEPRQGAPDSRQGDLPKCQRLSPYRPRTPLCACAHPRSLIMPLVLVDTLSIAPSLSVSCVWDRVERALWRMISAAFRGAASIAKFIAPKRHEGASRHQSFGFPHVHSCSDGMGCTIPQSKRRERIRWI